jgi:CAAX protease family protein
MALPPILTYYALVFAISWGSALVFFGSGVFLGTKEISFVGQSPIAFLAFLAGPSVAGILTTGLVHGKAGLRDVGSRLLRWRVGVRWYAVALVTAPLLTIATLLALSLTSPVFLPALVTSADKASLLLGGIVTALVVPVFEELGWSGFAVPELRKGYGVLTTGLMVGLIWGVWHFPLFSAVASSSTAIPSALFLAVLLFSWLLAYRVLMVWVYDRTQSLLMMMVMHAPIVFGSLALIPQAMSPDRVVTFDLAFAALLWVVVAAVAVANGGHLSRQSVPAHAATDRALPPAA